MTNDISWINKKTVIDLQQNLARAKRKEYLQADDSMLGQFIILKLRQSATEAILNSMIVFQKDNIGFGSEAKSYKETISSLLEVSGVNNFEEEAKLLKELAEFYFGATTGIKRISKIYEIVAAHTSLFNLILRSFRLPDKDRKKVEACLRTALTII